MADFKKAFEKVLEFEGGYVNDKSDSGGETKYGISKKAYPGIDIKSLTLEDVKAIYKKFYWDKIKGEKIENQKIAELIFDTAVNMGVRRAVKIAQSCLGVKVDGIVGNETIEALNNCDENFINAYKLQRIKIYVEISKRGDNIKFLRGWISRVLEV